MADARPIETVRLEAFSDAVFAIAATLLVIEVKVPQAAAGELLHALLDEWSSYAGYAVSFAVIGVLWVNHHATLERVAKVDRSLLFLNLVVLAVVAFIPFPTAVLADYIDGGIANARWATITYAVVMMAAAGSFALMWLYLGRHRELLAPHCEEHAPATAIRRALAGIAAYLVTVAIAVFSPAVAVAMFALLTVAFVFAERPAPRK